MALTRKAPAAAGVGLAVLAVLAVLSPTFAALIPTGAAVELLGNDYVLVAVVAALSLAALVGVLLARSVGGVSEATPPPVEGTTPGAPGRDVDDALDSLPVLRVTEGHERVHDRVRAAAVEAVAEADGSSRPVARERVESGEWTDDADAASFVADERLDPPGLGGRLAALLRRDDWFRRRVETTVSTIESLEEGST